MKIQFKISRFKLNLDPKAFNAMISVKACKPLYSHLLRIVKVMVGNLTANWVKLTIVLMRRQYRIIQSQGLYGLVKYQKACCVMIQQSIGGHIESDLTSLGPRVSRTNGGLPRILPSTIRSRIKSGDILAIKWSLTLLSLYRCIIIKSEPKLKTISSERKGSLQMENRIKDYIPHFWAAFAPKSLGLESLEAPTPFPMMTSSPNSESALGELSTHPASILRSRLALWRYPHLIQALGAMKDLLPKSPAFDSIWLWSTRYLQSVMGFASIFFPKGNTVEFYKMFDILMRPSKLNFVGKIGMKQEAAGKVRIFAMVDPFTQWLLKPLHSYLFSLLKQQSDIDGTFNQGKPLTRIPFGVAPLYSFDLSAATDRLPVSLQEAILSHKFGEVYAALWKVLLVHRDYLLPGKEQKSISYVVGQPMGALSSWAMLAFTHHFIVQVAA